jgi:hypothetical protein
LSSTTDLGYVILETRSVVYIGFEVLTAVVMKSTIFWDITPCSPLSVNQSESGWQAELFHAGFLLGLFFGPEDGGDMFLRNIG